MAFLAATCASTWIHLHSTTRRVHTKLTIYSSSYRFYNQQRWPPHHEVLIQFQEQLNAYPPSTFDKLYFRGHVHTWCYQNCDPHSFNEHKQMIPLLFCCWYWFQLVLLAITFACFCYECVQGDPPQSSISPQTNKEKIQGVGAGGWGHRLLLTYRVGKSSDGDSPKLELESGWCISSTKTCEQVFLWLSRYAKITQQMNHQHFLTHTVSYFITSTGYSSLVLIQCQRLDKTLIGQCPHNH